MRIFLTGATGFIGSAVAEQLLSSGHNVLGLARSDKAVEALKTRGLDVHRGELSEPETLAAAARECDGVIHTAFIHEFSQYVNNAGIDRRAIAAMLGAVEGTGKPVVATSVTTLSKLGQLVTEKDDPLDEGALSARGASERAVINAAKRDVRSSVVRLPCSVHGPGDSAFVPWLIAIAREKGVSAYVGDGANRWAAVHRLDAARLYCLALEKASGGSKLHAVAEEGIPMRDIAQAIGDGLDLPVKSIAIAEADAHFGHLAHFVTVDNPTSSAITRDLVGWEPRENGLLADMRQCGYFS